MENGKALLLIVSDGRAEREALPHRLREAGYSVAIAADDDEALNGWQSPAPDLVLLDVRTPGRDARDFVTRLKANEASCDIPVIVLARPGDLDVVEQCLSAGAEDYLLAPFSPTLLKGQVRDYLEIGRQRREERDRAKQEELLKIERDVQIARQIQLSFLPNELPQPAGWEFAARFHPAREVAGDFYDAFTLTQGRRVGFLIADVTDKGVGAALFMALTRSLTRAFAQQNYSLSWMGTIADDLSAPAAPARRRDAPSIGTTALQNAVVLTNSYITTNHLELNTFATMFFGMLDPASGQLAYINGGHNPPFIVGPDGVVKTCLKPTGPAVGMLPDAKFRIDHAQLDPGDILYLYTDGVTEARSPTREFFTENRLLSILATPEVSAKGLLDRVERALNEFTAGGVPFDDITMMAVRRIPTTPLAPNPKGQ